MNTDVKTKIKKTEEAEQHDPKKRFEEHVRESLRCSPGGLAQVSDPAGATWLQ